MPEDAEPTFPDPEDRTVLAADCRRCPALVDCRERICWGVGPGDAAVVVVGEAPGAGDPAADRWRGGNWTGMAYTSRHSGRRIRTTIERTGHRAYYTNAVNCFPCDGEGSNREPTDRELANCRPYLLEELARVDPAAVVTTGKHATRTVLAAAGRDLEGFIDRVLDPIPVALPAPNSPDRRTDDDPTGGGPSGDPTDDHSDGSADPGVDGPPAPGPATGGSTDGADDPTGETGDDRVTTTVLPLVHPSYREVWIGRLGYDHEEYVAAVGDALDRIVRDGD